MGWSSGFESLILMAVLRVWYTGLSVSWECQTISLVLASVLVLFTFVFCFFYIFSNANFYGQA